MKKYIRKRTVKRLLRVAVIDAKQEIHTYYHSLGVRLLPLPLELSTEILIEGEVPKVNSLKFEAYIDPDHNVTSKLETIL